MPLYEGLGSSGEKTAVVIDLGEAFTKCGFAGETGPRCIIPSVIKRAGLPKPVKVVQYNINTEELYSYLKEFIHILYFRHLLVNPRDRRVVVIESVLCPSHFRETLTRVLFKYFEVPSVLLAPSHLMALLTLGINSAMVLDCGYRESLVLPIYEGIPVLNCWGALPLGGKALHRELETQLLEQCTVDTGVAKEQSLPSVMGKFILSCLRASFCFLNLIRDSVVEILFEQDNEEKSVATLILDSLMQLMTFTWVLRYGINAISNPGIMNAKDMAFFQSGAYGAIFGALQDILGSRSVSKEYYNQTGRIPDWCSLNNPPLEMMFDVGKAQPPLMKRAFSTEK
ncbi:PREDICTED: actin-related protein 10 [Propithecus coquereli]|uniref:actin-related protein 10 n=1 Tax=Propithecus coquereli TaxID=379532 RepID=UPI00063F8F21|nr:PREDICTED: actin-related protein 10 [Propithecus coquereli]